MEVRLSKDFIDDLKGLRGNLQQKCWDLLAELQKSDVKTIRETTTPGWRLHQLKSSPFTSLSVDMNYRMLCKQEEQSFQVFRVVKHDLADSEHVNKNDSLATPYVLAEGEIEAKDVFGALLALGLPEEQIKPLKDVKNDEAFLDALQHVDQDVQSFALAIYETTGIVVPRSMHTVFDMDMDFIAMLQAQMADWELYLHSSQRYIVELPVSHRLSVSGAAGTGKTVCAWHRALYLAQNGYRIGFVCPNRRVLEVSRMMMERLLRSVQLECYYSVPSAPSDLIQLAQEVDHVIFDESQEFPSQWFQTLGNALLNNPVGLTVFSDLNQLGGNIGRGDTRRLKYRLETWESSLRTIPNIGEMTLHINYRNSKEIAEYYKQTLEPLLPNALYSGIPLFSSGSVIEKSLGSREQLVPRVVEVINALRRDYHDNEIGLLFNGNLRANLGATLAQLRRFGIPTTSDVTDTRLILNSSAEQIKGHERKAIVFCTPSIEWATRNLGQTISVYVALTRARDQLVVIQSP